MGIPPRLGLTSPFHLESRNQVRTLASSPREPWDALNVAHKRSFDEFSGHCRSCRNGGSPRTLSTRIYSSQSYSPLLIWRRVEDVAGLSTIDSHRRPSSGLVDLELDLNGVASPCALWWRSPRDSDVPSIRRIDGWVRGRRYRG